MACANEEIAYVIPGKCDNIIISIEKMEEAIGHLI
jgi:hypothetical protein